MFSIIYYHTSFQDPVLSVAQTSQVCASAMLLLLIVGSYKYRSLVACNGLTAIRENLSTG
jgi:hypothetical protein